MLRTGAAFVILGVNEELLGDGILRAQIFPQLEYAATVFPLILC
jgi:hypothetical protein